MRSLFLSLALCAAATAAQADTLLSYVGLPFTNISCNRPCHFTHINFTARVPDRYIQNGQVQFCVGSFCTSNSAGVTVTFSDGQSRLNKHTAPEYVFSGSLTLDRHGHHVTGGAVSGAQTDNQTTTLLYMEFGDTSFDSIGGSLHGANVDVSTSKPGTWTIRHVGSAMPTQLTNGLSR